MSHGKKATEDKFIARTMKRLLPSVEESGTLARRYAALNVILERSAVSASLEPCADGNRRSTSPSYRTGALGVLVGTFQCR